MFFFSLFSSQSLWPHSNIETTVVAQTTIAEPISLLLTGFQQPFCFHAFFALLNMFRISCLQRTAVLVVGAIFGLIVLIRICNPLFTCFW